MANKLSFRLVDAFADAPFRGNPAGVVLDADGLNDAQMQAIAREINASETAFVSGWGNPQRTPRLRWFTPTVEVVFCGHATLATAQALVEADRLEGLGQGDAPLVFESSAGRLELVYEGAVLFESVWWLRMPDPGLRADVIDAPRTYELLGIAGEEVEAGVPIMRTRDDDLIVLIKSWQRLMHLRPDLTPLGEWCAKHGVRGVLVSTRNTLSPAVHVHSRFFAPAAGVAEDPVTGSVHGPLAALLVSRGLVPAVAGRHALNCMQGDPEGRGGRVRALVEQTPAGVQVQVGGQCFTTLMGELRVPVV